LKSIEILAFDVGQLNIGSWVNKTSATTNMPNVWVPSALYKLVYDPATDKSWAYWVENRNDAKLNGIISYQTLVDRTGIHFLPSLEQ
jgi:endonuclease G